MQLSSGILDDVAEIYKKLRITQLTHDLSFGERKMLNQCKELLAFELAMALNITEAEVCKQLNEIVIAA
jgi:CarD family transcriptional regulator